MKNETLAKVFKKFGIDVAAKDAEAQLLVKLAEDFPPAEDKHEEPDGDEGNEILSKLAAIEERLCKLEGKDKVELAEDEDEDKPKDTEEQMATMAAKVCSIMLAKVGVKPRASAPVDDNTPKEVSLSAEDAKLATQLGIDHKQFAANLAAANAKIKQVKI